MTTTRRDPNQMPTRRQGSVLRELAVGGPKSAGSLGVRIDVMWRMQERGWVATGVAGSRWSICSAGRAALDRWEA